MHTSHVVKVVSRFHCSFSFYHHLYNLLIRFFHSFLAEYSYIFNRPINSFRHNSFPCVEFLFIQIHIITDNSCFYR